MRKAAEGLSTDFKGLQYNERVQKEKGVIKLFKKILPNNYNTIIVKLGKVG